MLRTVKCLGRGPSHYCSLTCSLSLLCAGSHITVFGSYVMDLYTGSSDLDLSLNVGHLPVDRTRADRIAILRKLTRILYGLLNGVYFYPQPPCILDAVL